MTELDRARECARRCAARIKVSRGHTAALLADGTVFATGDNTAGQCDVADWTQVVQIAVGDEHTVGLRRNGTILITGEDRSPAAWYQVIAVAAEAHHTLGLLRNGLVVASSRRRDCKACEVEGWYNILAIATTDSFSAGLKADGTVVTTPLAPEHMREVARWRGVTQIAAAGGTLIGLRADHTAVATGIRAADRDAVAAWRDLVQVIAGEGFVAAVKRDGTLVATGFRHESAPWEGVITAAAMPCEKLLIPLTADRTALLPWFMREPLHHDPHEKHRLRDVIGLAVGRHHVIGVREDGSLLAAYDHTCLDRDNAACRVQEVRLFSCVDELLGASDKPVLPTAPAPSVSDEESEQLWRERDAAQQEHDTIRRRVLLRLNLQEERSLLEKELGTLRGMRGIFRRREIRARLREIDKRLATLDPV